MFGSLALAFAVVLAPSSFRVEIDGADAGRFTSVEQGRDAVTMRARFGELSTAFSRRLTETLRGKSSPTTALVVDNGSGMIRKFQDALITEVTFPALDGSSKEPAYLTVGMTYGKLTETKGTARPKPATKARSAKAPATAPEFRVVVGGLPAQRVSKVESFTIEQTVVESVPHFEVSDIRLTIPTADATAWEAVVGAKQTRTGTITVHDGAHACTLGLTIDEIRQVKRGKTNAHVTLAATSNGFRCH